MSAGCAPLGHAHGVGDLVAPVGLGDARREPLGDLGEHRPGLLPVEPIVTADVGVGGERLADGQRTVVLVGHREAVRGGGLLARGGPGLPRVLHPTAALGPGVLAGRLEVSGAELQQRMRRTGLGQ